MACLNTNFGEIISMNFQKQPFAKIRTHEIKALYGMNQLDEKSKVEQILWHEMTPLHLESLILGAYT